MSACACVAVASFMLSLSFSSRRIEREILSRLPFKPSAIPKSAGESRSRFRMALSSAPVICFSTCRSLREQSGNSCAARSLVLPVPHPIHVWWKHPLCGGDDVGTQIANAHLRFRVLQFQKVCSVRRNAWIVAVGARDPIDSDFVSRALLGFAVSHSRPRIFGV